VTPTTLPEGRYLTCPVDVPVDSGGQTRALLMRNRIFASYAGIRPSVLSFGAATDLDERRATLLERGLLTPEVDLLNIYEHYRDTDWDASASPGGSTAVPAGVGLPDLSASLKSESALPDGSPFRRTYKPAESGDRVIHDYLRPDGTTWLRTPSWVFKDASTWPKSLLRVSREGEVVGHFSSVASWFRQWIRELSAGHERSFVFMDSRFIAPLIAPMKASNIHLIYLLHNIHVGGERRWDSPTNEVYGRLLDLVDDIDAFVTLTDRQREDIAQRRGRTSNLFVVPNPVDMPPTPEPPPARDPRLVTVVARLEGQKQLSHAIDAFRRVVAELPDARMEIWGSGSRGLGLQQAIDRRGLQDSVTMKGHHPQAREALWRSSAMVMTSLFEGYPLSTLESLSHGCPVVSYDIKYGPQEQVTEGVDGFLVPAGDRDALADRLLTLLRDPRLVEQMSVAARKKAEQHGYDRFVTDWGAVLTAAIALKARRTKLDSVTVATSELAVRRRPLERLRGAGGATTLSSRGSLTLRASLVVDGRSRRSTLADARVELAAVHEGSGAVVDVPVTVERDGSRLDVRADVPLVDLYAPDQHGAEPAEAHLRLRLVWENSAWQTVVRRPDAAAPSPGQVEVSYLADGRLRLLLL
jgi:poly(glycerol-phosphate) alpha-glucosyltransferase